MKTGLLSAAALVAALAGAAQAADAPPVTVSGAWSRATPPGSSMGVIYLTVTDAGAADTLTGISTPVAASAAMHESKTVDGVMQMRAIGSLPVTAAAPLRFAPGGYHIMLEGLKQPLKAGQQFPVTLTFAQAGTVTATVKVQPLGAPAPADDTMGGMDMGRSGH